MFYPFRNSQRVFAGSLRKHQQELVASVAPEKIIRAKPRGDDLDNLLQRSSPMNLKATAYPADRALLACVALTPTAVDKWRARIGGKEVGVTQTIPFATTVIDLMVPMEMLAAGPFDYLHYYISRDLIDSVAIENKLAPVNSYKMIFFEEDLLIAQLTKSILNQVVSVHISL